VDSGGGAAVGAWALFGPGPERSSFGLPGRPDSESSRPLRRDRWYPFRSEWSHIHISKCRVLNGAIPGRFSESSPSQQASCPSHLSLSLSESSTALRGDPAAGMLLAPPFLVARWRDEEGGCHDGVARCGHWHAQLGGVTRVAMGEGAMGPGPGRSVLGPGRSHQQSGSAYVCRICKIWACHYSAYCKRLHIFFCIFCVLFYLFNCIFCMLYCIFLILNCIFCI
jgi:hypothetical protein